MIDIAEYIKHLEDAAKDVFMEVGDIPLVIAGFFENGLVAQRDIRAEIEAYGADFSFASAAIGLQQQRYNQAAGSPLVCFALLSKGISVKTDPNEPEKPASEIDWSSGTYVMSVLGFDCSDGLDNLRGESHHYEILINAVGNVDLIGPDIQPITTSVENVPGALRYFVQGLRIFEDYKPQE